MAHITGNDILQLKAAMSTAGLLADGLDVPEWDSHLAGAWTAFVTRQGVDYSIASQQPVHVEQIEQYINLDRSFMDEMTGALENLGDSIDSVATEALAAVEEAIDPVLDKLDDAVDTAIEKVEALVEDVKEAIEDWTTEDDQKAPDADAADKSE